MNKTSIFERFDLALSIFLKITITALLIWWVFGSKPPVIVYTQVLGTISTIADVSGNVKVGGSVEAEVSGSVEAEVSGDVDAYVSGTVSTY